MAERADVTRRSTREEDILEELNAHKKTRRCNLKVFVQYSSSKDTNMMNALDSLFLLSACSEIVLLSVETFPQMYLEQSNIEYEDRPVGV